MRIQFLVAGLVLTSLTVLSCKSYDPVPASQCKTVVTQARKILGKAAESYSKMLKNCKAATDQERGCATAATSPAALLRCAM